MGLLVNTLKLGVLGAARAVGAAQAVYEYSDSTTKNLDIYKDVDAREMREIARTEKANGFNTTMSFLEGKEVNTSVDLEDLPEKK